MPVGVGVGGNFVGSRVGVAVGGVPVTVGVGLPVRVGVIVLVRVAVGGNSVGSSVGVAVGGVPVGVAVAGNCVRSMVGLGLTVGVVVTGTIVPVGVALGISVGLAVGVDVGGGKSPTVTLNTSSSALVSSGTRFVASDSKATCSPLPEITGYDESALDSLPLASVESRSVTPV